MCCKATFLSHQSTEPSTENSWFTKAIYELDIIKPGDFSAFSTNMLLTMGKHLFWDDSGMVRKGAAGHRSGGTLQRHGHKRLQADGWEERPENPWLFDNHVVWLENVRDIQQLIILIHRYLSRKGIDCVCFFGNIVGIIHGIQATILEVLKMRHPQTIFLITFPWEMCFTAQCVCPGLAIPQKMAEAGVPYGSISSMTSYELQINS